MQSNWIVPEPGDSGKARLLARELGVPESLARLLAFKGLHEPQSASAFLEPRLRTLSDPNLLPEMPAAVERIDLALRRKEKIVLYGDYDVDGVSSLALLSRVLRAVGGWVDCFLPSRMEEGYGLSPAGLERCFEEYEPELLIAMDCGTNAVEEIASIRQRGVDVIVVDHHEFSGVRPDCVALVNPKIGSDFHYLCSAGLAFKVAHALLKYSPVEHVDLRDYLDIVALATLADLVPLVEENRILVRHGIRQMESSRWPGITALMAVSGATPPLRGSDIHFRLGPRINASGRLGTAQESLELLLTDDPIRAADLARSLDRQNAERKNVERAVSGEVEKWVEENYDPTRHVSIVAGGRDWHHGVLGIVASRISKRFHRPSLVVGFDPNGEGKGSGRSIEGLSLVEVLTGCSGHLDKFGGHEMAAGLTLREEEFAEFRNTFERIAQNLIRPEMLVPRLQLHLELALEDINLSLVDLQDSLEPFGMANPQPLLFVRGVTLAREPMLLKEKHFRFDFGHGRQRQSAIFFNGAETELPRPPWDVAFHLERNEYQGRVSAQMQVVAIRSAA